MPPPRTAPGNIAGFGPVCTPELRAVGIHSAEDIRSLGWEEAYLRWIARFPARLNVLAAYGMIAAERDVSWLKLSATDKAAAQSFVRLSRTAKHAR